MESGLKPVYRDNRDVDFARTFGAVAQFQDELNVDSGGFPDQNKDGNPFECTGYSIADVAKDKQGKEFNPSYTYAKTLLISGTKGPGADMRDALKSSKVYGLLPDEKTPTELVDSPENINSDYTRWPVALDLEANKYRNGKYANIQPLNGDWFDGIRSAIQMNESSVILGTPWFREWVGSRVPSHGIIFRKPTRSPDSWHAWKVSGWKQINGEPYLLAKSWQGPNVGDDGFLYFSREAINDLWKVYGTQGFTVVKALPEDALTIKLDIMATLVTFLVRMLTRLGK